MRIVLIVVAVAVIGFVIFNALNSGGGSTGEVAPAANGPRISPDVYETAVADTDHVLLDVRTPGEVASTGVIPGAINIPVQELAQRVGELPEGATVVVYCNSGNRSRSAVSILSGNGYDELLDLGGVQQWRAAGKSLVPIQ